ncbi:MAG: hypothetical protein K2F87_00235 [Muribaculaceae bacterium]|nr:hypothetical protein [Muribaculaceae bacterium]
MGEITIIEVGLEDVMESLKLVSSYLGGKRENDLTGYDRVTALDSDAALVAMLMEDAVLLLGMRCGGSLLRWRQTPAGVEFTFEGQLDRVGLKGALTKAVGMAVLRRWLRITGSEYADAVSASADELAEALAMYFPVEEPVHAPRASSRRVPPM